MLYLTGKILAVSIVATWVTTATCSFSMLQEHRLGQLTSALSSTARLFLPGSSQFDATSQRWSALEAPKVNIVIVPGTEEDVAMIVS